ncbi:MAG: rhomboid family intramembrane serine protease [Spirochaetales bacterium]|nr:rhomboid family intramembrane serine protease [Spirochaetales bacterium]
MRISYNAPVTLTFSLLAGLILLLDSTVLPGITLGLFAVGPSMNPANPLDWVRLFSHVLGHSGWDHLMSNISFILLLGPILEEKYGSGNLLIMFLVTALITGLLNVLLLSSGLLGGSGIVFMMIMLTSLVNFRAGEIPLTFIAIIVLYISRELIQAFSSDEVSQFAHLIGGATGSLFGFLRPKRGK